MAKPMKRAGSKISYSQEDSATCMFILEALYEGIVNANIVEIERLYPDFPGIEAAGLRYEGPQPVSQNDPDQHIGTLSHVLKKKKATCIEAAAIVAAEERVAGREASVRLIESLDTYGEPLPYEYHAVVELDDGTLVDPSQVLPGYSSPSVGGSNVTHPYVGPPSSDLGIGGRCVDTGIRAQKGPQ